VPDSPEVRIARLDESLKNLLNRLEAISEAYAPTNKTVIENALKIAEMTADILDVRQEISRQVAKREHELRDIENKVLAVGAGVSDLERRFEKQTAAFERNIDKLDRKWETERVAQAERDRETRQALDQKARDDRRQRNRWIIGLSVAFITAMASVYLGTVLGG
jgi:t-SNARE complex subunit (syntaxin)